MSVYNNGKMFGVYYHLVKELKLDPNRYLEYFKINPQHMELILGFVGPLISKPAIVRESIDAKQRRHWFSVRMSSIGRCRFTC